MATKVGKPIRGKAIIEETTEVKVTDLQMYYKNPRLGNVTKVAESLNRNGQYRAIIVNRGTKTGRKNEILAGNHTWKAARQLDWDKILVSFIDVDDEQAGRIVLADNKTAQLGGFDEALLGEILDSLPDSTGTGYEQEEVDELVRLATQSAQQATQGASLEDIYSSMPEDLASPGMGQPGASADEWDAEPPTEQEEYVSNRSEEQIEGNRARGLTRPSYERDEDVNQVSDEDRMQAELQGLLEVREENTYMEDSRNFWQIPELRTDMLADSYPEGITTWGGNEATPDDGSRWYLYQYNLGGTKGLPIDRSVLCFFTHDEKFENWWEAPGYYTSKLVSAGLRYAVVPDFSYYYTSPRFVHLQGVYQAQWLGRFFQEAGIKVHPRVQFDDEYSLKFNMLGIPKNPPTLTCSIQNFTHHTLNKKERAQNIRDMFQTCIDTLRPTNQVMVYGGNPAKELLGELNLHGAQPLWVENFAGVRRETIYGAKDGLAKLSKKERDKIKAEAAEKEEARTGKKSLKKRVHNDDEDDE